MINLPMNIAILATECAWTNNGTKGRINIQERGNYNMDANQRLMIIQTNNITYTETPCLVLSQIGLNVS